MTEYTEINMDHFYSRLLIIYSDSHSFSFTVIWSIRALYFWEYQQRRKEASVCTMQFMYNAVYEQCSFYIAVYGQYSLWTMDDQRCSWMLKFRWQNDNSNTDVCIYTWRSSYSSILKWTELICIGNLAVFIFTHQWKSYSQIKFSNE